MRAILSRVKNKHPEMYGHVNLFSDRNSYPIKTIISTF